METAKPRERMDEGTPRVAPVATVAPHRRAAPSDMKALKPSHRAILLEIESVKETLNSQGSEIAVLAQMEAKSNAVVDRILHGVSSWSHEEVSQHRKKITEMRAKIDGHVAAHVNCVQQLDEHNLRIAANDEIIRQHLARREETNEELALQRYTTILMRKCRDADRILKALRASSRPPAESPKLFEQWSQKGRGQAAHLKAEQASDEQHRWRRRRRKPRQRSASGR